MGSSGLITQDKVCLVVDDEPAIRRLITFLMQGIGCEVLAAEDAESALQSAHEKSPAIAIIDIQLPDMDGIELLHHLRDDGEPDLPAILISAYSEPPSHDADRFIPKPFDVNNLAEAVSEVLEEHRS